MEAVKLRAWWAHRQVSTAACGDNPGILTAAGWARSVAGVGPYLTLFARGGIGRELVDRAVADLDINELPTGRGCTYVVPAGDYALARTRGQPFGGAEMKTSRKVGVTDSEIEKLERPC